MAKSYHPCYTNVNPAVEARKYTSEMVYCRKVTLQYTLPKRTEVESWLRRVPYQLEKSDGERSWVVKHFEFRAGIGPLPKVGFIGDLWISWDTRGASVWFKVEEEKWRRWGGYTSSIRGGANGKHPFLGNMCLWVQPRKYFLEGQVPCREFSLGWDRQKQVRKLYPAGRVMEPDSRSVKKEIPLNPIYLPGVKTTVRMLCSNMALVGMRAASPPALVIPAADRQAQRVRGNVVATTSRVQVEDLKEPSPTEEIGLGDDIEIDWDWWGSTDGEAEDETIEAEDFRPRPLASTSTPLPATPSKGLRYHPYRHTQTPFKKFKPPVRYTRGTLDPNISPNDPLNTPTSSPNSSSSTVVNPTTPVPQLADLQKPSRSALEGIARILREDGYDQSGICALLSPELYDAAGNFAAELPVPVLDLEHQTSHEIRRVLRQDGFTQSGILILKIHDPRDD